MISKKKKLKISGVKLQRVNDDLGRTERAGGGGKTVGPAKNENRNGDNPPPFHTKYFNPTGNLICLHSLFNNSTSARELRNGIQTNYLDGSRERVETYLEYQKLRMRVISFASECTRRVFAHGVLPESYDGRMLPSENGLLCVRFCAPRTRVDRAIVLTDLQPGPAVSKTTLCDGHWPFLVESKNSHLRLRFVLFFYTAERGARAGREARTCSYVSAGPLVTCGQRLKTLPPAGIKNTQDAISFRAGHTRVNTKIRTCGLGRCLVLTHALFRVGRP